MLHDDGRTLLRAGLLTAVVDGIFATCLAEFGYGTGAARMWRGVASTLLGPSANDGGAAMVLVGLVMHVGVAFTWSTIFLAIASRSEALRRALAAPGGVLGVALVWGPLIWTVMSFVVIPSFTGRLPTVTPRWWIQASGHVGFVALPMAWAVARGLAYAEPRVAAPAAAPNILA